MNYRSDDVIISCELGDDLDVNRFEFYLLLNELPVYIHLMSAVDSGDHFLPTVRMPVTISNPNFSWLSNYSL